MPAARDARPAQVTLFDPAPATPPSSDGHDGSPAAAIAASQSRLNARRLRTIMLTAPLIQLELNKVRRGESWLAYDMRALQLYAIQTVVDHMGLLDGGVSRLAAGELLTEMARGMAPDRDRAEHDEVARVVIDWLLNSDGADAFSPTYADVGPDGGIVRRQTTIEILRERQEPDGGLVLRASVEAINLLLGVLSEDVADAQRAEERLLEDYIAAGRFDAAIEQARRAQLRSIQYAEQISRWLGSAQQNLAQLDWSGAIKNDMDAALSHLRERLDDEARMLDRVEEKRRGLEDSAVLTEIARITGAINDCHDRHTRLHGLLLDAGPLFRREQERQRFVRTVGLRPISMREGLDAILKAPIAMFASGASGGTSGAELAPLAPADTFFRALVGPIAPPAFDLARLVAGLFAPGREMVAGSAEIPEVTLVTGGPMTRFSREVATAVEELLATVASEPRRLSTLLAEVRRRVPENPQLAAELVRLRALEAYAPDGRNASGDFLIAEQVSDEVTGGGLDDPAYGGDDLLIGLAVSATPATREN